MLYYTQGVTMIKIIVKAIILVCIILSIYFIVNPSACSNLLSGRAVNSTEPFPTQLPKDRTQTELLTPTGDKPLVNHPENASENQTILTQAAPTTDTTATSTYSQEDIDYAIASRYVELENQYAKNHPDTKNAAKDIAYIVMDDFELTPAEWEAFLQRATANNLFEKVRQEQTKK